MFHVGLDVVMASRVQGFGRCMSNPNRAPHFTTEKIVTNSRVKLSLRSVVVGTLKVESKHDKQMDSLRSDRTSSRSQDIFLNLAGRSFG
jgi:hypothetical protein